MRLVLAALLILAAVGSAFAQPASSSTAVPTPRRTLLQRFEAANVTHDGKLTRAQAEAGGLDRVVAHFDAIDVRRKGYVTMDDLHSYARARRAAKHGSARTQHPGPYRD